MCVYRCRYRFTRCVQCTPMLAFTRQCFVNIGAISASEAFGHLLPTALEQCLKPPLVDDYAGLYQNPLGEYHQYIDTNTIYWEYHNPLWEFRSQPRSFFKGRSQSPSPPAKSKSSSTATLMYIPFSSCLVALVALLKISTL